jgi:hypothetical protein
MQANIEILSGSLDRINRHLLGQVARNRPIDDTGGGNAGGMWFPGGEEPDVLEVRKVTRLYG